jgi:hypothetical protein
VEVCAGSARLSAALAKVGFQAVGVDSALNKDKPEHRVLEMDLTTELGAKRLS